MGLSRVVWARKQGIGVVSAIDHGNCWVYKGEVATIPN